MEEELLRTDLAAPDGLAPPIVAFVAAGLGSHGGRCHNGRGGRGGRDLPNKCNAYVSMDIIMSSCTASDDVLLKRTFSKRKMIFQKYNSSGGNAFC
jgi:hypothetical protein